MSTYIHKRGDLVGGRYNVREFVGEGGMQEVYRARDKTLQRYVALKTPKNPSAKKRFRRSAIVSAKVNHPNVAKTLDYFDEKSRPYLIEEYLRGRDLQKVLSREYEIIDPYLAARIFHHLCKGLAAAHHAGVMHRDLKPSNIMVVGKRSLSQVKITDFGIAKMADEELIEAAEGGDSSIIGSKTMIGALPYMAPEAISAPKGAGQPVDVWSVGAILYELLSGDRPYGSGLAAVPRILAAAPPSKPKISVGLQFRPLADALFEIVTNCLAKDPSARPTADDLVKRCGELCYPISEREFGTVKSIHHSAWGFLTGEDGHDVFFHMESVYGKRPTVGDRVCYCSFPSGEARRAHPVVVLRSV